MEEFLSFQNLLNEEYINGKDDEIEKIIREISKFNIIDFIIRIAALNLISENQNKSILFDYVIEKVLELKKDSMKAKMSDGKFKMILKQIENLSLSNQIDPVECMFVDNIMCYENYLVFQGVNNHSAYNLQNMIEVLLFESKYLPEDFVRRGIHLIMVVLEISNKIAQDLNITLKDTTYTNKDNNRIKIPGKAKLNRMCEAIQISTSEFKKRVFYNDLLEDIYSECGQFQNSNSNINELKFFNAPFLEDEGKTIILNISLLPAYVLHKVILLANKYNCKEMVLDAYNNKAFKESKKAITKLGHQRLKAENWHIKLEDSPIYKEDIYSVYNDKVLILRFLCDDGKMYNKDSIFSYRDSDDVSNIFEERTTYLLDKFKQFGVLQKNIFEIIIMNSTGRILNCGCNKWISESKPISLHTSELECIAINEKNIYMFLPRYIKAKNKLKVMSGFGISELNLVQMYTSHEYSFYLNDEFNPTKTNLFFYGEYAIEYIIKANEKADKQMVDSYVNGYCTKVSRFVMNRNIYSEVNKDYLNRNLLVKYKNICIWIIASKAVNLQEYEIYNSLIDCLSYWLSELESIVGSEISGFKTLVIEFKLIGEVKKYFEMKDISEIKFEDNIKIIQVYNKITININDLAFGLFAFKSNEIEKKFSLIVLNIILGNNFININKDAIDKAFINPNKKKFLSIQLENNPMGKPVIDKTIRKIRLEDEAELLDLIGEKILKENNNQYGIISDEKRNEVANKIVGYLYQYLESEVKKLSSDGLIELLIAELEKVAFNLYLSKKRYESELLCYPEKAKMYISEFSELNKSSRALKFLIEYVAAIQPNGTENLGEWEFEKILAICSQIIDWAYKNDLFRYNIFNTPIEVLKSDRIGMKQAEFNKLDMLNRKAMDENLKDGCYGTYSVLENIDLLNEAFIDELGFSFDEFKEFIWALINLNDKEVATFEIKVLINKISNLKLGLNEEKIRKIIDCITLIKRDNFLNPPKGYRREDVYPWRFNRELSFTRRPAIIKGNELLWGNRQLYHMLIYIIDAINEGKFKAKSKKMKKLIGDISNRRGEAFNDAVYEKIKKCGFKVFKNIKKINKKKITDENRNELGDIDILYIIPKKKVIVVGEVKDFNFSKSPHEMQLEYEKMFKDTDTKKSFVTKHQRRCEWVKEHIEDLRIEFGLENAKWRVKSLFLVNEPIISNSFYGKNLKVIIYNNINEKELEKI